MNINDSINNKNENKKDNNNNTHENNMNGENIENRSDMDVRSRSLEGVLPNLNNR